MNATRKASRRSARQGKVQQLSRVKGTRAGLTPEQRAFVAAYDRHFGNGTRAWLELHPAVTVESAATQAWRMLRNVEVRAAIAQGRAARLKRLQVDGDEALALASQHARADIRELFDDDGKLLSAHLWPDSIASSVESVVLVDGQVTKIKLVSKSTVLRTLLEQTGKLKTLPDAIDSLAEALRHDLQAHGNQRTA